MRTRKNKNLSAVRKTPFNPFSDLITYSENTISSQASVISKKSHNYVGTQSQNRFDDFQFYEDIISEQTQQLKISPQQQKRIQSILQLARKGKINPGNAFEIPLQVADPQLGQGQNMRFWKFASELLHASMGIYDKRVQHVFLGANRMFDSLIRVGTTKIQDDQQIEVRQQRKKAELMRIDISELGDPQKVAGYQIASINCQQRHKISLKTHVNQYVGDPLFVKTLQAFDSDSLRSLFLNVFETGPQLQVLFFHEQKQDKVKKMEIEEQPMIINRNYGDEQQSTKIQQIQVFPSFINEEFKKLNLIAQTKTSFASISSFDQEISRVGVKTDENYLKGAIQSFSQYNNTLNASLDLTTQKIDDSQELSFSQHSFNQQITTFSLNFEPQISQQVQSAPIQSSGQSLVSDQSFFSYVRESNSLMTPWQYEFNGTELMKKKNLRKKGTRNKIKQQNQQKRKKAQLQIDFLQQSQAKRKNVFICKNQAKLSKQIKYEERNLLPISFDPRIFSFYKRKFFSKEQIGSNLHSFKSQKSPLGLSQNHQPRLQTLQNYEQPTMIQLQQPPNTFEKGIQSQNTMNNIRELKEKVLQKVYEKEQIFISQINLGISIASMLVIILHLVNQQRLQIVQELEGDIKLRAGK